MKSIKYLSCILVLLIIGLIVLNIYYKNHSFNKPDFEENVETINIEDYENTKVNVNSDYSFYATHSPKIEDGYMTIEFANLSSENVYLKLRVMQGKNIIGESGLIKTGEMVEKVKINEDLVKKNFVFLIMSYEKDTYYSLGEVKLNVKVGE